MQYQDLSANSGRYSKTASIPYVGLPSHSTVVNWDYDGNLPMGASLLACTCGTTNKKLIDCDSKQSSGGVANMDLQMKSSKIADILSKSRSLSHAQNCLTVLLEKTNWKTNLYCRICLFP